MSFLSQIISGWPGLFIVVLLWIVVRRMYAMSFHTTQPPLSKLHSRRQNPLYSEIFLRSIKRQLLCISTGSRLSFKLCYRGYSPASKSRKPDFSAFWSGSVMKTCFLSGVLVVLPTLFRVVLFSPAVFAKALSFSIPIRKTQSL